MRTFLPPKFRLLPAFLALVFTSIIPSLAASRSSAVAGTARKEKVMHPVAAAILKPGSRSDQALLLEKCLTLAALQPYYPTDSAGRVQQLYVLQHGISFPADMAVEAAGKPVVFISKSQLNAGRTNAYFLFFTFTISEKAARIDFVFNYDQAGSQKRMVVVSLELGKQADTWNLVQSKIEERAS